MRLNLLFIFFLFGLLGCGLSNEEKVDDAITQAHQLLTSNKCAEAISILNSVGQQTSNPDWLSAMASAQACLAPWNVVRFFETDLGKLSTASETAILGSAATFTQAVMVSPTDPTYTNLRSAINTLLSAGGITTISYANRAATIGASGASNLAMQTLYMLINQIGQFSRFYGDATPATGTKGSGGTSGCYIDYTDTDAQDYINNIGPFGSCNTVNEGNANLTGNRARLCEGIVLFNNFIDILGSITINPTGNNGNLSDLNTLANNIEAFCADATANYGIDFGGTCTVKTQSTCENNVGAQYNIEHIERYYAIIWETLHQ